MICHLSEVYATAVINVLLRIVATSDMEEATSSNLVTPIINNEVRGLSFNAALPVPTICPFKSVRRDPSHTHFLGRAPSEVLSGNEIKV